MITETGVFTIIGMHLWGGLTLEGEGQSFSEGGTICRDHLDMRYKTVANVTIVNLN